MCPTDELYTNPFSPVLGDEPKGYEIICLALLNDDLEAVKILTDEMFYIEPSLNENEFYYSANDKELTKLLNCVDGDLLTFPNVDEAWKYITDLYYKTGLEEFLNTEAIVLTVY